MIAGQVTTAVVVGLLLSLLPMDVSSAEPPRGTPWSYSGYGKQNEGNTYNCDTHNQLSGGQWDRFALDMKIEATGEGDPIASMMDGRVVQRSLNVDDWGYMVTVDHGSFLSRYGHLKDPPLPADGARVRAGQTIGYEGSTGAGGIHLHFQWGKGSYTSGTAILPEPITARNGNTSTYAAFKDFDTDYSTYTSTCPKISTTQLYYGARPLTDVFLYNSATGAAQTRLAVGDGTFSGPLSPAGRRAGVSPRGISIPMSGLICSCGTTQRADTGS